MEPPDVSEKCAKHPQTEHETSSAPFNQLYSEGIFQQQFSLKMSAIPLCYPLIPSSCVSPWSVPHSLQSWPPSSIFLSCTLIICQHKQQHVLWLIHSYWAQTRPSGQPDQKTQKKTIQYYVTHFSAAQVTTYCFSLPFSLTGLWGFAACSQCMSW